MRIAAVQLNTSVGDLEGNALKIVSHARLAAQKADLVVFPELTITGYPPRDLLLEREFVEKNRKILLKIAEACTVPCIVGFVDFDEEALYNSAALLEKGSVSGVQHKILLPSYDVFDEKRYFTSGTSQSLFEIDDQKIGVEICEDLWEQSYARSPTTTLQNLGADIIINISASPYCVDKIRERLTLAAQFSPTFVYCNQVGGQDELVFDGQSFVMKRKELIKMGKAFQEDLLIFDTEKKYSSITPSINKWEQMFNALVLGVRDYCRKAHFEKVVLGISGGIDSSVVACIAVEALGKENVVGLFMPSPYTSQKSKEGVTKLAENLGISSYTIPITSIFDSYKNTLKDLFSQMPEDETEENIQARIRGNLLMAFSNKFGHLVLTSGNKTELALGYCTLYGDMSGGISVIGDVSKVEVYKLALYYNSITHREIIPVSVIERIPSAELKEGQVDPFDYAVVSPLVDLIIEKGMSREDLKSEYPPQLVDDILGRIRTSEYKRRQAAPVIKVTPKAFGIGRRYPIVSEYE